MLEMATSNLEIQGLRQQGLGIWTGQCKCHSTREKEVQVCSWRSSTMTSDSCGVSCRWLRFSRVGGLFGLAWTRFFTKNYKWVGQVGTRIRGTQG